MKAGQRNIIYGLHGSARSWMIDRLSKTNQKLLVICKDRKTADEIADDIRFFHSASPIYVLPPWDTLPFEPVSPQILISAQRIQALFSLAATSPSITVASVEGILQKSLPVDRLMSLAFTMEAGAEFDRVDLLRQLDSCGFTKVSLVENVGDFALRGGVLDIFPSTAPTPIRIEFDDSTISRIRSFSTEDQRTKAEVGSVHVLPVREILPFHAGDYAKSMLPIALQNIKHYGKLLETPPREIAKFSNYTRAGSHYPGMEVIQPILLGQMSSILEVAAPQTEIIMVDELAIHHSADSLLESVEQRYEKFASHHYLLPPTSLLYQTADEFITSAAPKILVTVDNVGIVTDEESAVNITRVRTLPQTELKTKLQSQVGSGKALEPLKETLSGWRREEWSVGFVVGSTVRAERLQGLLKEIGIEAIVFHDAPSEWINRSRRTPIAILTGYISSGVQIHDERLALISENEIFRERSYRKKIARRTNLKRLLSSLSRLVENDYVVHSDYGIGIYRGLKHIDLEGKGSDFLHIEYADSRLYLPIEHIGKVQRFSAAEGQTPIIDKLGSTRWVKTKQKVRESIIALAGDLIKLYAARSIAQGWQYEPYGAEDDRFADGFPYDETPDQMKAIEETISDMSSDKPMDRLVCGDVGFGKTEVAIRAAFKCVQHQRQVALLVPTTILVEQHAQSMKERFMGYPAKIGVLSRFYSAAQNRETLSALASGELDIIVGTHKLLSRNVNFKDLGLLIIDEEHRFGVQQKERLKQLKTKVDVLTLTATPIPRTLHMSLLGIRDISVISTPPVDRRVIRTYIAHQDETLIRDAILRELQRGGQCFYVFNRIQGIDLITAELAALVPEAKICFAHGQMSEHQLEDIMERFIRRDIDILVSTTIIESGLDIPNANTILIDRADTFGLAQLYQLRGRVGRSTQQAFAYFLIPKAKKLGGEAQQRLKVLQSLDDLGLGFNLALRDMEIRGVGNLLGKEQSGSVLAVGYELYTQILKEAVFHLQGNSPRLVDTVDPEVKLGLNAFIPDYFIPDISERLVMYQRLSSIITSDEARELRDEIEDRFGPLPLEASDFVELMRFRGLLRQFGVTKGEVSKNRLLLSFSPDAPVNLAAVLSLVKQDPEKYRFGKGLILSIALGDKPIDPELLYNLAEDLLSSITDPEPAVPPRKPKFDGDSDSFIHGFSQLKDREP